MYSLKELVLHELMIRYHGPVRVLNQFHIPEMPHCIDWDKLIEETTMELSFELGEQCPNLNQSIMLDYLLCQYYDIQPLQVRQTALASSQKMAGYLDKYIVSVPDNGYLKEVPATLPTCDTFSDALEQANQALNLLYVFSTETGLGIEWYGNANPEFLSQIPLPDIGK